MGDEERVMSTIIDKAKARKEELMKRVGQAVPAIGARRSSPLPIVKNTKARMKKRFPKLSTRAIMSNILSDPPTSSSSYQMSPGSVGLEQKIGSLPPPASVPPKANLKTTNGKIIL